MLNIIPCNKHDTHQKSVLQAVQAACSHSISISISTLEGGGYA